MNKSEELIAELMNELNGEIDEGKMGELEALDFAISNLITGAATIAKGFDVLMRDGSAAEKKATVKLANAYADLWKKSKSFRDSRPMMTDLRAEKAGK